LVYKKREVLFILGMENGIYLRVEPRKEDIESTAMREVEEETGVNQLRITTSKLQKTYHVLNATAFLN
jgi:hypothetical protein